MRYTRYTLQVEKPGRMEMAYVRELVDASVDGNKMVCGDIFYMNEFV